MEGPGLELMLFLGRSKQAWLWVGLWEGGLEERPLVKEPQRGAWEGRKVQERYEAVSCGVNGCDRILFPSIPFQRPGKADTAH